MTREGKSIAERLRGALWHLRALVTGEGSSVNELTAELGAALFAVEPAFQGIIDIYPDSKTVYYSTCPGEEWMTWQRTYSVGADGEAALNDDAVRVEQRIVWDRVAAEGAINLAAPKAGDQVAEAIENAEPAVRAACGCEQSTQGAAIVAEPGPVGGTEMSEKLKELAGRLIGCARLKFQESDRAALESLGEEKLAALDALDETPPAAPAPDPNTVVLTKAEHAEVMAAATAYRVAQAREKAVLVAVLKTAQTVYSEPELEALGVPELEKLAALAKVQRPDFSARSAAPAAPAVETAALNPPDAWAVNGAN